MKRVDYVVGFESLDSARDWIDHYARASEIDGVVRIGEHPQRKELAGLAIKLKEYASVDVGHLNPHTRSLLSNVAGMIYMRCSLDDIDKFIVDCLGDEQT